MIINVPIEPVPIRYSIDWDKWFVDYFNQRDINHISVKGKELTKGIEQGRFLDCIGTNYYKSSQLMWILQAIQTEVISDGDVIFLHDLWFPGIEQIRYTCDALGLNVKIMGCLHAGAYDPHDMLYEKGMGRWAIHFEHMLFALVDKIFVATNFHRELLYKSRSLDMSKVEVTGFPIYPRIPPKTEKLNQIVFPHRFDSEKNPHLFKDLQAMMKDDLPDWEWVTTANLNDKEQYYTTLEKSEIAISFSDQETWGIAMQEAVIAGCVPLVPNKLSYKEMYLSEFKYDSIFSVRDRILEIVGDWDIYKHLCKIQGKAFIGNGDLAFTLITQHLLEG